MIVGLMYAYNYYHHHHYHHHHPKHHQYHVHVMLNDKNDIIAPVIFTVTSSFIALIAFVIIHPKVKHHDNDNKISVSLPNKLHL